MDIPWDDVKLFLAVAEGGSLSAAARRLRVAQPTVSRRLAELEARLGEGLFARGVEGATLTAYGARLLAPARRMAEWSGELERAAERSDATPRGVVRISAPPGLAYDFLTPFAASIRAALPEVCLEVAATVRYVDLARREADLALRMQRPATSDLAVLATLAVAAVPLAARAYAAGLKRRARMADVAWVAWAPPFEEIQPNPTLARLIPGFRPAFASDDYLVQLRAAELGLGAMLSGRLRHRFKRATDLVPLALADAPALSTPLHLVCARSALDVPRVGAVADLLARELAHCDPDSAGAAKRKR